MSVMIQIRNVPDELHRKLKARAAEAGMSLSDFILRDVKRLADRPTEDEWLRRLRTVKPLKLKETTADTIRAIRGR